jgi:hypothetical protein
LILGAEIVYIIKSNSSQLTKVSYSFSPAVTYATFESCGGKGEFFKNIFHKQLAKPPSAYGGMTNYVQRTLQSSGSMPV